jgi:hypothetical protein
MIVFAENRPSELVNEIESDGIMSYGKRVLEIGILFKSLLYLCKSPDYNRFISMLKLMLLCLYNDSKISKYCLEIMRYLTHQLVLWSPRKGREVFYGSFVNTTGSIDGHIPADLQMEYVVKEQKKSIKHMYAGQTERNIDRRSASISGSTEIAKRYDKMSTVLIRASKHNTLSAVEDEKEIVNDLRTIRPFKYTPGRRHEAFKRIGPSSITGINMDEMQQWIKKKKKIYAAELGK